MTSRLKSRNMASKDLQASISCLELNSARKFYADRNNEEIKSKIEWTSSQDSKGLPTVPSTIAVSASAPVYRCPKSLSTGLQ